MHKSARKLSFPEAPDVTTLEKLRAAKSLDDVAVLLGFSPSGMSFVIYKIPPAQKYRSFEIPKRGGGNRLISAPEPRLALLQRRLANVLYDCLDELKQGSPPPRRSLAHGFEKGRSIITNANLHKRRRYVLNLDLQDFFPTINFGRVRGFFLKDKHFALEPKVATILAQIACHENELPQGSPCSPVVSNLIGHLLDSRLARFAKLQKCTYSRFADDLTFSTNLKSFPSQLAVPIPDMSAQWQLGAALRTKIEHSGFKINDKKTRMQYRSSRQVTTGLMVNDKVNIRQEYWRAARNMCKSLFTTGAYYRKLPASLTGGAPEEPSAREEIVSLTPIEGVLAHIHQVKDGADLRKNSEKREEPTAARKLYHQLLFYRSFVALEKPVIVPEGKTDIIYLRCAIRRLGSLYSELADFAAGKFRSKIRLMNFTPTIREVLELGGGAAQLNSFIARYHKTVSIFQHAPLAFPVIVLVDNDDGGKKLFGLARNNSHSDISYETTEPFYYLGINLYLIKTPERSAAPHTSCMEDLFEQATLATVLNGKTFDLHKEHDAPGSYGKFTFASRVVEENADKIDFSRFAPLLDRIVAVLQHHAALRASAIPTTLV